MQLMSQDADWMLNVQMFHVATAWYRRSASVKTTGKKSPDLKRARRTGEKHTKGAKDKVKRSEEPPARSRAPEGLQLEEF